MARLHQRQPILPEGDYVARKNFTFNGKEFKANDNFPYEDVGCDERKLATLFKAGYIIRPIKEEKSEVKRTVIKTPKVEKKEKVKEETVEAPNPKKMVFKSKDKNSTLTKAEKAKLRRERRKAR